MNEANVYAPPETDIRQSISGEGDDPALRQMSTKELKKLFNHSNTIRVLIFLWCLGLAFLVFAVPVMFLAAASGDKEAVVSLVMGILFLVFGALQAAGVYGCWNRLAWGRTLGIVLCALSLPSFPIGTIIGILGIIAFSGGGRLFGPDRLTHERLKAEVAYRKANNIR